MPSSNQRTTSWILHQTLWNSTKKSLLRSTKMPVKDKYKHYKSDFTRNLKEFAKGLSEYVANGDGQWKVKGFIDILKNIYTISADTKIISKILEIHLFPAIVKFADDFNYNIVLPDHQNYYPDLSFVHKENDKIRFAVDIKTTFRILENPGVVNGFTLGSHGSYFKDRNSNKNIQFPYNTYLGHYCIGIIYTRTNLENDVERKLIRVTELQPDGQSKLNIKYETVEFDKLDSIVSVIKDFTFFACEKWQLASDIQGSGNTANIGSIIDIEDIINGNGMFANLGEKWFDEYWINYGKLTKLVNGKLVKIKRLKEYVEFKGGDVSKINPKKGKSQRKK